MASLHQELRPALCKASRRTASRAPKAVHFDKQQYLRHFYPDDLANNASPVERVYLAIPSSRHLPTWEMVPPETALDSPARKMQPVRLERVWLSPGHTRMHGSVSVSNLAFAKSVACRLSFDSWTTIIDVPAEYKEEVLPQTTPQGHDRFTFTISLPGPAHLAKIYFCLRYSVDGQEFWDNNNGKNFQLTFTQKVIVAEGLEALPRQAQSYPPACAGPSLANRYNFSMSLKAALQWPHANNTAIRFQNRLAAFNLDSQMRYPLTV